MKHQELKNTFFTENRNRFHALLKPKVFALVFSNEPMVRTADQEYIFRQRSDLFYLTGINQPETIYVYNEQTQTEVLFISVPDEKRELWDGKLLRIDEAIEISGIQDVRYLSEFMPYVNMYIAQFSELSVSYTAGSSFAGSVIHTMLNANLSLVQSSLDSVFAQLRIVKNPEEISLIKHSIQITHAAFNSLIAAVKPGHFEYQVEAEIIHQFISHGADGHAFDPIVAAGKNACTLHYIANNGLMQNGDLVLLDFGSEYNGYAADMSRTLPVGGKFTPRQRAVYEAVLEAQKMAIDQMKPGAFIKEINKITGAFLQQRMIDLGLFTEKDVQEQDADNPLFKRYFPHGTSHFMGLDVHDVGATDKPLEAGMVLTCEPGLYIPEEQIGVRIENDILITENGCEDLMAHIPREIDEIELLMAQIKD